MGDTLRPSTPEVLILGAGVIGLSLALELRRRRIEAVVVDRGLPMAQASAAAAGMLAVEDPHNPLELRDLSRLSRSLYVGFLENIANLSGRSVPFQTDVTVQFMPDGSRRALAEQSIDPRQLAPALIAAVRRAGVRILAQREISGGVVTGTKERLSPGAVVYATGAWPCGDIPVSPRKGQMLRLRIPPGLSLREVYRAEHIYIVPRTQGPQAGSALIGATVEDAGFDTAISPAALSQLRRQGAELVPALADESLAPTVEAWAGLRPAMPDGLPVLGEIEAHPDGFGARARKFIATGHFRNGILLAPATAVVMADLIEGRPPLVSLEAFSPARFASPAIAG